MSTLDKISEALSNLDSDSPVAEALAAVVGTEKSESALPLVDAAGHRMADAFHGLHDGKSVDDVRPLLKSAAALLLAASGDLQADYRTMSKSEFEEFAAGEIAKAAEAGIEGGALDSLKVAIDVANVLFKGDNASRRFALPLPVVAKSVEGGDEEPAADEGGEAAEDAPTDPAAEGGEAAPAAEAADEGGEAAPAAEGGEGGEEPAADAAADESASDDTEKKDDEDKDGETDENGEPVVTSWPVDMRGSPSDPAGGCGAAA